MAVNKNNYHGDPDPKVEIGNEAFEVKVYQTIARKTFKTLEEAYLFTIEINQTMGGILGTQDKNLTYGIETLDLHKRIIEEDEYKYV